jgi:hypothetical protein
VFLIEVAAVMHRYYFCNVPWTDTNPLIAFLDSFVRNSPSQFHRTEHREKAQCYP